MVILWFYSETLGKTLISPTELRELDDVIVRGCNRCKVIFPLEDEIGRRGNWIVKRG